jgi:Coenzyme PQQ synthesis protein D (PqqD)
LNNESVRSNVTGRLIEKQEIRKSGNVVSRVVADEAIVVPIRRGVADMDSIFTFNEVGTELWNMIEAKCSAEEMTEFLRKEYGLTAERAAADTERFITDLATAGLIDSN